MCALIHCCAMWHQEGLALRLSWRAIIRLGEASSPHPGNGALRGWGHPVSPGRSGLQPERGGAAPHPALRFRPPETGHTSTGAMPAGRTRSRRFAAPAGAPLRAHDGACWQATRRVPPALLRGSLQPLARRSERVFRPDPVSARRTTEPILVSGLTAIPCSIPSALAFDGTGPVPYAQIGGRRTPDTPAQLRQNLRRLEAVITARCVVNRTREFPRFRNVIDRPS